MTAMTAPTADVFPPVPAVPTSTDRGTPSAQPRVALLAPPAPPALAAMPDGPIARVELLLRDPDHFLDALDRAESSPDAAASAASLTRTLVGAVALGAGLFGAVVGAHRGGLQVLWCAVKVPLLLLLTLVVCAPPFVALARAAAVPLGARQVIALALGSCARFALVLVGLAPFVWLAEGWSMGYHRVILAVVAVCAAAGVAAGRLLFAGLARAGGAGTRVGLAFVALFALVGAQSSWILRPFVVRPRTERVPFVRALEGDFLGAVATSARSAAGVYSDESVRAYRRGARDARCEGPSCD